jgi:hypothetical protein
MSAETEWNHEPYLPYLDRYATVEAGSPYNGGELTNSVPQAWAHSVYITL